MLRGNTAAPFKLLLHASIGKISYVCCLVKPIMHRASRIIYETNYIFYNEEDFLAACCGGPCPATIGA
jgi:hypothetical protein